MGIHMMVSLSIIVCQDKVFIIGLTEEGMKGCGLITWCMATGNFTL